MKQFTSTRLFAVTSVIAAMFAAGAGGIQKANAAEIARDIYKYYFGKTSKAEKKATTALLPSGSDGSND